MLTNKVKYEEFMLGKTSPLNNETKSRFLKDVLEPTFKRVSTDYDPIQRHSDEEQVTATATTSTGPY